MKKLLILTLLISAQAALACNVSDFVQSKEGQAIMTEMDQESKAMVTAELTKLGMSADEFTIESRIPTSFISMKPGNQYQWSKFKVDAGQGLKTYYGGILVKKEKKKTYDAFDRVSSEVCGVEITIDPGVIWNKRSQREIIRFSSNTRFIPLN